ncbi:MAG TPA: hypothetical protein VL333_13045 [Candidatus Saccharimonadales bacterium]|jgi:hypothetical protein|nr:hypothetical protein [Candidatus Saccharimonadales bacterium]
MTDREIDEIVAARAGVGVQRITQEDGPRIAAEGRRAVKRANPVFLVELKDDAVVETVDGTLNGEAGGFIAHDPISGHVWPVKRSYVEQHYDFKQPGDPPSTVTSDTARELYKDVNAIRRALKDIGRDLDQMRRDPMLRQATLFDQDVGANITIAFRDLESASMRLGKALQAIDGGVSVYDKETTVGA